MAGPLVNTIKGPVETSELGFTLMHEHVFIRPPGVFENWPHLWDRDGEVAKAIKALKIMEDRERPFLVLPVLDRSSRNVVGMIHIHDLVARGL